ncbi:unnamed protein product [Vicia faba]|uniref:Uncharacterized protein n=1 Tax=Vicia faba TaxID=3906 RepID=A0AAV0Z8C3_VICFA|nr:unnamed protein product [Vicia faba]
MLNLSLFFYRGYTCLEYAMLRQFFEKYDVYSFGVMFLEIMIGKKNVGSYESCDGVSLLSYVWRQWRGKTPLNILDPNIKGTYSESEVKKCIQIGLLCAQQFPNSRARIATVISYFNNDFIELPTPQEPAFSFPGQMDANPQESSSTRFKNTSTALTINELSITELFPR